MSTRNSLRSKRQRRRTREVRHVGGCAICGSPDVVYVDEKTAADPSYRAICERHLAYAVATIFGQAEEPSEVPGPPRRRHPSAPKPKVEPFTVLDRYQSRPSANNSVTVALQNLKKDSSDED